MLVLDLRIVSRPSGFCRRSTVVDVPGQLWSATTSAGPVIRAIALLTGPAG